MKHHLVFVALVLLAAALACGTTPPATPAEYVAEYGGSPEVYAEILALTDCAALQEKFDVAAANNEREEPGTDLFRVTLGYMAASDARMKGIGCYE